MKRNDIKYCSLYRVHSKISVKIGGILIMYIHKIKRVFILVSILCFLSSCYVFCVYNGYILLNNPSKHKYPVAGVDLSHYQGSVDWDILDKQNIQFAYIKATEGSNYIDKCFSYNWEESEKEKLKVGAYHFFSFDSPGETQADNFIKNVKRREGMLPPVVDVEYYADKKNQPPDPLVLREQLQVLLNQLQEHYDMCPVIYSTEEFWRGYLEGYFEKYPLWIRNVYTKPQHDIQWTFWQYSNRGRLKGYSGSEKYIDLNVFNGDEEVWEAWMTPK